MTRKSYEGFVVPQDGPLTEAERGWIEILRVISYDAVPAPSVPVVQALREALDAQRRGFQR